MTALFIITEKTSVSVGLTHVRRRVQRNNCESEQEVMLLVYIEARQRVSCCAKESIRGRSCPCHVYHRAILQFEHVCVISVCVCVGGGGVSKTKKF
jgi:hypothetical protein